MASTTTVPTSNERQRISTPTPSSAPVLQRDHRKPRYEELNRDVLLLRPVISQTPSGTLRAPRLVILFGYMDAPTKSLTSNYADVYHKLYPSATVVIVKMRSSFFFVSLKEKESLLKPVVDVLLKEIYDSKSANGLNGLLIHILSNGGGFQFMTFASMVERTLSSPQRRTEVAPVRTFNQEQNFPLALIFDSVPGSTEYASVHSFTITIRNPLLRILAQLPMVFVLTATLFVYSLVGTPWPFGALRSRLARLNILPGSAADTKRLYIYGTDDSQVPWEAVERHLLELRSTLASATAAFDRSGVDIWSNTVRVEKFTDSKHVSHAKTDPARYWSAIQAIWESAIRKVQDVQEVQAKL